MSRAQRPVPVAILWCLLAASAAPAPTIAPKPHGNECAAPNDACSNAIALELGVTPLCRDGATSDGPPLDYSCGIICDPTPCYFPDIWFTYVPEADGRVDVSLQGDDLDSTIAVFEGCECPAEPASTAACDYLAGRVSFAATEGTCYLFQVGASAAAEMIAIVLTVPPLCPLDRTALYVDDDAAPGGDGTSWASAMNDLGHALEEARNSPTGAKLRVAGGVYRPGAGSLDRQSTFSIPPCVDVVGGYAGLSGPVPGDRDIEVHRTILTGDLDDDDSAGPSHMDDNAFHVVTLVNVWTTANLDGLTIIGGNAQSQDYRDGVGGGIYCEFASPAIQNCKIEGNRANRAGAGVNDCDGPVQDTEIVGNRASSDGGGLAGCDGQIERSEIHDNTANGFGGGMYACNGRIDHCEIHHNSASRGGGLAYCDGEIVRSYVGHNTAHSGGGLSWCHGLIHRSVISHNIALYGLGGGLRFCDGSIRSCLISGNQSQDGGGGLAQCDGEISNCTITGNIGPFSGAVYYGGVFTNCIFHDNGERWSSLPFHPFYSCIPASEPQSSTNVSASPRFVKPGHWDSDVWVDGDYRLVSASPAVDAGDPEFVSPAGELDIAGRSRVQCKRVDMGAFEFGAGDMNCDGVIDLEDSANSPGCLMGPGASTESACELMDFDGNRHVDLFDMAQLQLIFAPM